MEHKIIMLSGKQGSGKTTLADSLAIAARERGYDVVRTRFAKILYEMHDAAVAVAKKYGINAGPKEGEMLQWIGTEWGRTLKGQNVWVDALKHDIEAQIYDADRDGPWGNTGADIKYCFIIDDMRFPNEFDAFETEEDYLNVSKVRLEADRDVRKARCSYWRENESHVSETGLDDYLNKFDVLVASDELNAAQVLDFVTKAVFK